MLGQPCLFAIHLLRTPYSVLVLHDAASQALQMALTVLPTTGCALPAEDYLWVGSVTIHKVIPEGWVHDHLSLGEHDIIKEISLAMIRYNVPA